MTDKKEVTDRYIGLCMAAGGIVTGFDSVLAEVRHGRAKLVMSSSNASDRTKKQLSDKCKYYNIKFSVSEYSGAELAHLLGKRADVAALAFNGKGPFRNILGESGTDSEKTEGVIVNGNEI